MKNKKNLRGNAGIMKPILNGNSKSDFDFNFSTQIEKFESEIKQITRPGKVLRCFRCVSCQKPRTQRKMSAFVNVCRQCLAEARTKSKIGQSNFISKITNNFLKSIRAEVLR